MGPDQVGACCRDTFFSFANKCSHRWFRDRNRHVGCRAPRALVVSALLTAAGRFVRRIASPHRASASPGVRQGTAQRPFRGAPAHYRFRQKINASNAKEKSQRRLTRSVRCWDPKEIAVGQDNRAHPRFETSLDGRLLSTGGGCNLPCTIADLSEGGARVRTRHGAFVPDHVFLLVNQTGDILECEQRWARDNEIGLLFVDRPGRACRKALIAMCERRSS